MKFSAVWKCTLPPAGFLYVALNPKETDPALEQLLCPSQQPFSACDDPKEMCNQQQLPAKTSAAGKYVQIASDGGKHRHLCCVERHDAEARDQQGDL